MGAETSDLVLTLQSSVAYGHVGNASAAFALQRLGRDVIRIDTVRFSNHPKHEGYAGGPAEASEIDALMDGLERRGMLKPVAAVLSGYLGTAANGAAVARAVEAARRARPDAIYCLDPVIGDLPAGRFVAEDIPPVIQERLAPLADIMTPNAFELGLMSGMAVEEPADAIAAARRLQRPDGRPLVVATGVRSGASLTTLAIEADAAWAIETPVVAAPAYGAGDLFCAVFLGRYLEGGGAARALGLAANAVHAVFRTTADMGAPELALIAAQGALADPPDAFAVSRADA